METENRKIIFIRFFAMIAALVVTIGLVGCRRDGSSDPGVESGGMPDLPDSSVIDAPDYEPPEQPDGIEEKSAEEKTDEPESDTLRVYMDKFGVVPLFEAQNSLIDVTVLITDDRVEEGFNARDDLIERLRNAEEEDLPDVIILRTGDPWNGTDGLLNLTELAEEGLFYNLDDLNISLTACNSMVMEAGIYEGKRVYLPLQYSVGMLYTTEERLEASGIRREEGMDLEHFSSFFPEFYRLNPYLNAFRNNWYTDVMCALNGLDLRSDSVETRAAAESLCRAYNDLFPGIRDDTARYVLNARPWYAGTLEESWETGDLLFLSGFSTGGDRDFLHMLTGFYDRDTKKGKHPLLFPMPTLDGGAPYPIPTYAVAVSRRTEHPEAAAEFIRYLLDKQTQIRTTFGGIPVNLYALDYWHSVFLGYTTENGAEADMDAAFVDRYFEIVEFVRSPVWWDAESGAMLTECALTMAENGGDFEAAYASVREKLDAYFK